MATWKNTVRGLLILFVLTGLAAAPSAWSADSNTGESAEIQYSSTAASDLKAKAAALGSLVNIYEYVRNNYDFALYHGARSGSINTFLGGRGNDVDLAATLIAMLRSLPTPTPSRYVVGTVRVPAAQVMNWLAVENVDLAYAILRDQGIQGVVLAADKSTIDFEHVWVEALVPYDHYRGAGTSGVNCVTTPSACHWVPLDPSFKQRQARSSGLDPYSSLSFDYTSYYNTILNQDASRLGKNPLEIYQEQVLAWLQTNAPGKTLQDIPDFLGIIPQQDGLLPASLPYATIGTLRRYNSAADHDLAVPATEPKKWTKTVSVAADFGGVVFQAGSIDVVEASTKQLTFTWEYTPGHYRQVLRVGGVEIGAIDLVTGTLIINGQTIQLGSPFSLVVTMDGSPAPDGSGTDQVITATYDAVIGGYYLVATGGETSNWSQVHRAAQQLLASNIQYSIVFNPGDPGLNGQPCDFTTGLNCTPYVDLTGNGWDASDPKLLDDKPALDALTGGLLYVAATQYYAKMRDDFAQLDALNKIKTPIAGFLGVVSATHDVEYIAGTAFSVLPGGLLVDMKGIQLAGSWRIDQPAAVSNKHFELLGHIGSSLEHEAWQELTGYDAVSTVRGIQMALTNGGGVALLNPKKNAGTDTLASAYPSFGFTTAAAPAGFTYTPFNLFGTQPATWTNATNGAAFDLMKTAVTTTTSSLRLARANYVYSTSSGLYAWVNCVDGQRAQLQTYINNGQGNSSASLTFCDGSSHSDTINNLMTQLQTFYLNTVIPNYIGTSYFAYFDIAQGFVATDYVYRVAPPGNGQLTALVNTVRNDLDLRDVTQSWSEYEIPSQQTVGATFHFGVGVGKFYDTPSGNLVSASFSILNASIAAGGGYVDGSTVLLPAKAILGTSVTQPTYNNATLTDQNTIAETNNDRLKTASTADPVSTVTGNNYHDETDFTIKGRGINYAFTRTYNSAPSSTKGPGSTSYGPGGALGFGWTHSYNLHLKSNDYGICPNCAPGTGPGQRPENGNGKTSSITYTDERGGEHNYLVDETTFAVTPPQGEFDTLAFDTPVAGQHTITFRNGTKYIFEGASNIKTLPGVTARLKQIADPWGNQLNFAYDGSGRLATVTDNLGISGRSGLTFGYDGAGHLSSITDWASRSWGYSVDTNGNLMSYTNPLAQTEHYTYAAGTHNLFEVKKPLQRNGQDVKTAFTYYENGRAFNDADSLGDTETLDYDLYRNTTRVTDPRGGIRTYEYDSSGRMTKLTEPDGAVLFFANTAADGLRYRKTDGLGYQTQYSYKADKSFNSASDSGGNVTREQDALNNTIDTTYGPFDQVATVKDKRGTIRTTNFHATSDGVCKLANKPDTVTLSMLSGVANVKLVSYCWNSDGTLKSQTEYLNPTNTAQTRVTTYTYDTSAHLNVSQVTVTGYDGATVTRTFTYDNLGRKKTETLNRRTSPTNATLIALTTSYDYDALDRTIHVTDALGNMMETVFDANGQVYQVIGHYKQPDNSIVNRTLSTRTYDAADRMVSGKDVYNNSMQYQYDAAGNLTAVIDPYLHTTGYEYDPLNRRTAVIDANGNRTATTYDLAGHVKTITNANGETTTNAYDALGRLTSVTDPLGFITQMSYDANGNLTCSIDANAQAGLQPKNSDNCTESRVYDELNRVVQVKDALNGLTTTTYDLLGDITSIKDAANKTTSFAYDGLGRQISTTDPLSKTTVIARDEAGNAYQVTSRLTQVTQITFDKLNRPTRYDYLTDGTNETITYDPYGNKATVANATVTYTFQYDDKNRLLSKTDSRSGKHLNFGYDAVDNLITKTDYQNATTDFQYDSANRLVSMRNPAYLKAIYQYDPAGRLLTRVLSDGVSSTFSYDAGGRLSTLMMLSANNNPVTNLTYTRDRVGHITQATGLFGAGQSDTRGYTYDALYRLKTVTSTNSTYNAAESFTYDAVGNRQVHTDTSTHAYEYYPSSNRIKAIHTGTLGGAIEKSFIYDDEGRLTSQSGAGAKTISWDQKNRAIQMVAGANTDNFLYDPMDYRIGRTGGTLGSRDYYLEGEHLEAEYANGTLQAKYFRGIATDELVAGFTLTNGTLVPSLYHHDQLTSVTGQTAHDGSSQQGLLYSAFGNLKTSTGSSQNRLRYTGREIDLDTNLYYYRARYYDPSIGRFISEDPLGFGGGDVNLYVYVNNDPIDGNDPSGEISGELLKQLYNAGVEGAEKLFARAKVGLENLRTVWDRAEPGPNGGKLCPTCGTEVTVPPGVGVPRDWHADHFPDKSADIINGMANDALAGSVPSRADVLEKLNNVDNLRLRCPTCNMSDNQAGSAFAAGAAGLGSSEIDWSGVWSGVKNFVVDTLSDPSTYYTPLMLFTPGNAGDPNHSDMLPPQGIWAPQSSFDGAAGGFLLYPNKANLNQLRSVYSK